MKFNSRPIALLKAELEQNGIAAAVPELVEHESVLAELDYALRPVVHEGRIQPYGFIVCSCPDSPLYHRFSDQEIFELNLARSLADGCHSFLVFTDGQFRGVLPLSETVGDESRLTQLQQSLQAVICITDTTGTTRVFCDHGVLIHQHRRWQQKPSLKQALYNICQCVSPLDEPRLRDILAFCFYELSPQKIGATLVWCLKTLAPCDMERMLPSTNNLQKRIQLNISNGVDRAILRHLLTYNDGAVFLDHVGIVIGGGAHLKYSEASRRFIPAYRGTRHTSAKRFSFDFTETILFVVSSDGLVTVFSDGMNIVNLKTYAADGAGDSARLPSNAAHPVLTREEIIRCSTCQKTCKIQLTGWPSLVHEICCPVCGNLLYAAEFSVTGVYVTKHWLLKI
jgi:DNA integrity scanning protein DisA with diadenylate cyclase activity